MAKRAVVVACIAKENNMVLQLQYTRWYFYGRVILATKVFLFSCERTVGPKQPSFQLDPGRCIGPKQPSFQPDPGRCIPQRCTIAIVGVSPREENQGAIEWDARCPRGEAMRGACLYPRPATPTLRNECRLSLPRKMGEVQRYETVSMEQKADGPTEDDLVLVGRTKCGVILLRLAKPSLVRWCSIVRPSSVIRHPSSNHSSIPHNQNGSRPMLVPRSEVYLTSIDDMSVRDRG
jgi:hypothetical protein